MLVILRSAVFNVLFYLNLLVHFVVAIPTLVMPRMAIVKLAMFWGRTNNWLLRVVCGIKVEYRGLEKIPAGRVAGRLQASIAVGDLRAAVAVFGPGLHPQARAAMDSVLRLVRHESRHDPGRSRPARAGADRT